MLSYGQDDCRWIGLDEEEIWMGLGLSFLLVCQGSERFAYNDGRVDS